MPRTTATRSGRARAIPLRNRWRQAIGWLIALALLFFATYGATNAMAARHPHVPSIAFAWERHIPFLPWTIVPYWSITVFYAISLFVCRTPAELHTHVLRLLTAQVVAVTCFTLFPLRFAYQRPEVHGVAGVLFATLNRFDQPFNQAPSLHVAFGVILWRLATTHVPRRARWPLHVWFALAATSVLTTWQHHFVDVPTGALLGLFSIWLWPDRNDVFGGQIVKNVGIQDLTP